MKPRGDATLRKSLNCLHIQAVGLECLSTTPRYIMAEIGDDYFTDATWKCSSEYSAGWATASFDDNRWIYAENRGSNNPAPSGVTRRLVFCTLTNILLQ